MKKSRNTAIRSGVAFGVMLYMLTGSALAGASPTVELGKRPGETTAEQTTVQPNGGGAVMQTEPAGQTAENEGSGAETGPSGINISALQAAQDTDQVITVVGSGMDSSRVQVAYFKKGADGVWNEEFFVPGYCGHNGMADDKREGDRRTPTGMYSFTSAFGIRENPGSVLPYKLLDSYDYWVDDSSSRYYNQMVSTKDTKKDWNSAEHLIGVSPQYNYSIALDYNTKERTPGKGSAIFIHGYHTWKTWTEGCIAIPEENMKTLIQNVDSDTRIVIVPDASALVYAR